MGQTASGCLLVAGVTNRLIGILEGGFHYKLGLCNSAAKRVKNSNAADENLSILAQGSLVHTTLENISLKQDGRMRTVSQKSFDILRSW